MPAKRDREGDDAPVRGGFGVDSLTGTRNVTIDMLMDDMSEMKKKIDDYVTKMGEQTKQIQEQDERFTKQAVEMAEKDKLIAQITQNHQMHEEQLKREYEAERQKEKKEFTTLQQKCTVLEDVVQRQVRQIQALKSSGVDSASGPKEESQTGKSLNQQLNEALNERTVQDRHLRNAQDRIAQLENALRSNDLRVPLQAHASAPVKAPAPAPAPTCGHNSDDFVEKWKYEKRREVAQREIGKKIATINDLTHKITLLKRELLQSKVNTEELEKFEKLKLTAHDQAETIKELEEDNEHLQASIEDHQASIEDLQSKLEEFESRIEEVNESCNLEIQRREEEFDSEREFLQGTIDRYWQTTVDRVSYDSKVAELDNATAEIKRLEHLTQHNGREKDDKINELQADTEELKHIITETETKCNEKIQAYEDRVQWYEAQIQGHRHKTQERETEISKNHGLVTAKIAELEKQIAQFREEVARRDLETVGLSTQLDKEKTENSKLLQQIRDLGQSAQNRRQGEQGNVSQSKSRDEKYYKQTKKLQQEVKRLNETLRDYEAQARAHVCTPAVPASPTPCPAPILSFSDIRCESTAPADPAAETPQPAGAEYEAAYADLIAATEKWSCSDKTDVACHPPVLDRQALASAEVVVSYTTPTSLLSSTYLPFTPPSSPHASTSAFTPSTPSLLPTPPSSPPEPAYDPRQDVPDIDSWWYDKERFAASWERGVFEYKRTIPYCDNCRTRRALRLVDGEWKKPLDFYHRRPCAKHGVSWTRVGQKTVWQEHSWHEDCAECIEADSPCSQEEQLPEQLKQKYKCRGYSCPPFSDKIQQEARFVLSEEKRFRDEESAAWWRHHEHLDRYRAVYGRHWPAYKVEQ